MWRNAAIIACVLAGACTNKKGAREMLDAEGYTDIRTSGYSAFSCGSGDWTATGFTATSIGGRRVDGVVCCGMLKSCTVRVSRVKKAK